MFAQLVSVGIVRVLSQGFRSPSGETDCSDLKGWEDTNPQPPIHLSVMMTCKLF